MKVDIHKCLIYMITGMGFGFLSYLLILLQRGVESQSVTQIANVVWISASIGLVCLIFEIEELPLPIQLTFHCGLVYSLVSVMNWLNHYELNIFSLFAFGQFILLYFLVWLLVYLTFYQRVRKINQTLVESRKKS